MAMGRELRGIGVSCLVFIVVSSCKGERGVDVKIVPWRMDAMSGVV